MDPNYAMAKFRMESKDIFKSKQKGCWYYLKYFFIFSSIIQFLIILGLVLFMLYGNAHVGTELRLKSVENRYKNLTADYNRLNGNFTVLKNKQGVTEKQLQNCSFILAKLLQRPPPIDACRTTKYILDQLNTTCTQEKYQLLNEKIKKEREFDLFKNTCTQTTNSLTKQMLEAISEKEKIQREKTDLESQLIQLQSGCSTINEKFEIELDNMRKTFEKIIYNSDSVHIPSCTLITNSIRTSIDIAITRLRQDVTKVMLEISQVKVNSARVSDDLQKCNQDKEVVTREKTKVISEKGGLEKQLAEKNNDLNKYFTQYLKKEEELENCRKPRIPGQRM
ncbi:plasmalemma vesicle-associated protein [Pseudophryne corroboree]|uniref:plasmalemma vesicle-associated protein n=1 Tax=Pseudophryne corroboree TaxID=495146 RepID=UPI0030819B17